MSKSSARMLALAAAMALLLTGCDGLLVSPGDSVRETLPAPVSNSPAAPVGDDQMLNSFYAWLSYPNADGTVYAPVSRLFTDTSLNDEAFAALQALLEGGASSVRSPAPEGTRLVSVEIASRIATVNLIPGRMLSDDEKATIAACVSATLFNLTELSAVNVLLAGRPLTLYSLPVGALRESDVTSISDLKEHLQRDGAAARSAAVYYPDAGGRLVVPTLRSLSADSDNAAGQLLTLLASAPGQTGLLPAIAAREGLLTSPCTLSAADNNRLVLDIPFSAAVYDALEESDVSRWQFLASVVLTLTTYIDELDGIRISFDGKPVKSVPLPDGGSLSFENNLLTRADFSGSIGEIATLYFVDENGALSPEFRALPAGDATSIRARLALLMEAPLTDGLASAIPDGITPSDLLGAGLRSSTALINLSRNVYALCQPLTPEEEARFVYAIVNTLACMNNVNAVRFYVEGQTVDTLSGSICIKNYLLPNRGLCAGHTLAAASETP